MKNQIDKSKLENYNNLTQEKLEEYCLERSKVPDGIVNQMKHIKTFEYPKDSITEEFLLRVLNNEPIQLKLNFKEDSFAGMEENFKDLIKEMKEKVSPLVKNLHKKEKK